MMGLYCLILTISPHGSTAGSSTPADLPQIDGSTKRGIEWGAVLGLPPGAYLDGDDLASPDPRALLQSIEQTPGAIEVGVSLGLAPPDVQPKIPTDYQDLFSMLLDSQALELEGAGDDVAAGFAERLGRGDSPTQVLDWMTTHPNVVEIYLSDAGFERVVAAIRPESDTVPNP